MSILLERSLRTEQRPASFEERVGPQFWGELIEGLDAREAAPGEVVATGDGDTRALAVLEGSCRVFLRGSAGRQTTLRYSHRGDVVGLLGLLGDISNWAADAVVRTRYVPLKQERVCALMDADPRFTRAAAAEVATIAFDAIRMVASVTSESMAARVAAHLLEAATPTTEGRAIAHVTHQRLADSTGTAREVVTRMLRRFREAGAVFTGPGTIEIIDRDLLLEVVRSLDGEAAGAA